MNLSFDIIKIKIGSGGQMAKSLKISKSKLATWWWILETGFVNKKCLSWRVDNVKKKVWPPWCPRTILTVIQSLAEKFGYFGGILYLSNVAELRHSKYVFELLLQYQLTGGISFNSTPYPMFKGFNSFLWNYLLNLLVLKSLHGLHGLDHALLIDMKTAFLIGLIHNELVPLVVPILHDLAWKWFIFYARIFKLFIPN